MLALYLLKIPLAEVIWPSQKSKGYCQGKDMDVGKWEELGPRKQSPHSPSMYAQVMIRYVPDLIWTWSSHL